MVYICLGCWSSHNFVVTRPPLGLDLVRASVLNLGSKRRLLIEAQAFMDCRCTKAFLDRNDLG